MPPPLRACPVRSIASGFFAHISLVIDGLIRCDDDGALPVVRISDDNTKQPNFYLDRRGDDLWHAVCRRSAPAAVCTAHVAQTHAWGRAADALAHIAYTVLKNAHYDERVAIFGQNTEQLSPAVVHR